MMTVWDQRARFRRGWIGHLQSHYLLANGTLDYAVLDRLGSKSSIQDTLRARFKK
jgi:hypothetical protein